MGERIVDEDSDTIVVVLDGNWVHGIFVTPKDHYQQVQEKWEAAGFKVCHEWASDLQYRVNSDFEVLPEVTRPAQIHDRWAKTYALPGGNIENEPIEEKEGAWTSRVFS